MITSVKIKPVKKRGRFDAKNLVYKSEFTLAEKDGWEGGGTYVCVFIVDKVYVILGGAMSDTPVAVCPAIAEDLIEIIKGISNCKNVTIEE